MAQQFKLRIITPERVFYEGMTEMIVFQSVEGELGVLAGHIPLTTVIDSTVFYLKDTLDQPQKIAAVHEGFVQILPDQVTVLTEAAEWPDEIDESRAQAAKERAEKRLANQSDSNLDLRRAQLSLMRSLTRLQVKK
jgi:F-type H+-transporting ATPase subunit epsilon